MNEKKFIFAVITYNHSKYIIEHLESIKYLISKYGVGYRFKLVIADDGSKDNTIDLARFWISKNSNLFLEVIIEADGVNKGTCVNYTNLWKHIDSDFFKITAGDDVYSFENIIKVADELKDNDFISGMPLILIEGEIKKSSSTIFFMLATDIIYKKDKYMKRMSQISVINTPSLLYNSKFLKDTDLFNFIRKFKVTEDYPMMVKIAETYNNIKFKQSENIYVYYRRTSNSTYLVRGAEFDNDKLKMFEHMLSVEKGIFSKLLLENRIACYQSNNSFFKMFFNLNYYVFFIKIFFNLRKILKQYMRIKADENIHQKHYFFLKSEAGKYILV